MGPSGKPTGLRTLLKQAARRNAGNTALTDAAGGWSYEELDVRADRAAAWLAAQGAEAGSRVCILLPNGREAAALVYGASHIGACAVVLGDELKPFQLDHILRDAEPAVVVDDAGGVRKHLETAAPAPPIVERSGLELLVYTSGSTSMPKGVMSPPGAVLFAVAAIQERLGYRSTDVIAGYLPLSFDYALYQLFLAANAGACVALGVEAGPALLRGIAESSATVVPVVPPSAAMIASLGARRPPIGSVRLMTNTGAALHGPTIDALRRVFPRASLVLMYGTTECKRISIHDPDGDRVRPGASGLPLSGTRVRVVDGDGNELAAGAAGELVVSGPHVMAGYWNAPELTATAFRPGLDGAPMLFTGDYGWLDLDGYVYVEGRRDSLYKQNGLRVSAQEVEAAALDVAGVENAVLIPPDEARGRPATIVVVGSIDPAVLAEEIRDRLPLQKAPPACRIVPALPLGRSGKVDRRAVAELLDGVQGR